MASVNCEEICDEWFAYIDTLDLEQRKDRFLDYLMDSGIYDADSETKFVLSELNNFITEGISSMIADKVDKAKKSGGKGIAHYRQASFAFAKPDAMNEVHEYVALQILNHNSMEHKNRLPKTFDFNFLFNLPNYVNNKPLYKPSEIPQLPKKKQIQASILDDTLTGVAVTNDTQQYSPDPFDVDGDAKNEKEYSPDPFDVDENEAVYTPGITNNPSGGGGGDSPVTYDGIKSKFSMAIDADHELIDDESSKFHRITQTTIAHHGSVSPSGAHGNNDKERYLDNWANKDGDNSLQVIGNSNSEELDDISPPTPTHKKQGSTIQGGYWKAQQSEKVVQVLTEITHLNDSQNIIAAQMEEQHGAIDAMKQDIETLSNDIVSEMSDKLNQILFAINTKISASEKSNDEKISKMQALLQQNMEKKNEEKNNLSVLRKDILAEIENEISSQFESQNNNNAQLITQISEKQDDIFGVIGTLQKEQSLMSKDIQSQMRSLETMIEKSQNRNNNYNNNNGNGNGNNNDYNSQTHQQLTHLKELTAKLTQDQTANAMLTMMRGDIDGIRKEKEEIRRRMEQMQKENDDLSLKKRHLEEEAINMIQQKQRTVQNLISEMNDMRTQIVKMNREWEAQLGVKKEE